MTSNVNDGIDCGVYDVYVLNGVMYVPHYREDCYVGPGFWEDTRWNGAEPPPNSNNTKYSEQDLVAAGAKPQKHSLWKRVAK